MSEADTTPPGLSVEQLSELFETLRHRLHYLAWGVLRCHDSADDVVQRAYTQAQKHRDQCDPASANAWLARIVTNEALQFKRRIKSERQANQQWVDRQQARDPMSSFFDSPDYKLLQTERIAQVREAIEALPETLREVVQARVFDEQTFAQIARTQHLPLGTVLTRMRRALASLRETLSREDA